MAEEKSVNKEKPFKVRARVTIRKETNFFGPGIVELMSLIEMTGSVKEACRQMELSYTKGWFILNRAEEELGYALIHRSHGGKSGGGALLTEEGSKLLDKYNKLQAEVQEYTEQAFARLFADGV
ncbi:MAG: LysR family transcriptional regulator [Lachnospiraceae bacterium]|nr:LysR family transcriptional regulator [Lachnospiraceae bacterium]